MFVEIKDRPCLVAGGGAVASRKVRVLQEFGADVTVVAREFDPSFRNLEGLKLREKSFELSDIGDSVLVIAATDDHKLNHEPIQELKKLDTGETQARYQQMIKQLFQI